MSRTAPLEEQFSPDDEDLFAEEAAFLAEHVEHNQDETQKIAAASQSVSDPQLPTKAIAIPSTHSSESMVTFSNTPPGLGSGEKKKSSMVNLLRSASSRLSTKSDPVLPTLKLSEVDLCLDDTTYIKNVDQVHRIIAKFKSQMEFRDKKKGMFFGKDILDFIQKQNTMLTRDEALEMAGHMELLGAYHHVEFETGIIDNELMFEFPNSKKYKKIVSGKKYNASKKKLTKIVPFLMHLVHVYNIEEMNLSLNELRTIPKAMFFTNFADTSKRLKVLKLNNNQFSELPEVIGTLHNLVTLDVSNNNLTKLPTFLANLQKLESLELSYNKLTVLEPEVSKLSKLKKLYLNNNNISELPASYGRLTSVKVMHVFSNPIMDPPMNVINEGSAGILNYLRKKEDSEKLKAAMKEKIGNVSQKKDAGVILDRITFDPKGREAFKAFLKTEFSEENFLFWEAVEEYRKTPKEDTNKLGELCMKIYNTFISEASTSEINIPAHIQSELRKMLTAGIDPALLTPELFAPAQNSVLRTLKTDSLPRFLKSPQYKTYKTSKVLGISETLMK